MNRYSELTIIDQDGQERTLSCPEIDRFEFSAETGDMSLVLFEYPDKYETIYCTGARFTEDADTSSEPYNQVDIYDACNDVAHSLCMMDTITSVKNGKGGLVIRWTDDDGMPQMTDTVQLINFK